MRRKAPRHQSKARHLDEQVGSGDVSEMLKKERGSKFMSKKRKVVRFRVALFSSEVAPYTVTADNKAQETVCQQDPRFMYWVTDWMEVAQK